MPDGARHCQLTRLSRCAHMAMLRCGQSVSGQQQCAAFFQVATKKCDSPLAVPSPRPVISIHSTCVFCETLYAWAERFGKAAMRGATTDRRPCP